MNIPRTHYITLLHSNIEQEKKLIILHGGRGSGKTTLLRQIVSDHTLSLKKYYFSFEDDIVAKKFKNSDDFKGYMQIKYGIDFHERNVLLLNEIQYSKNIIGVLHELIQDSNIHTTIIATGIIQKQANDYINLVQSGEVEIITIHPLSFFDFLEYKDIHVTYLDIDKPSQVMFRELQGLLDEYLIRGGYPEVIKAVTKDRKQHNLKTIIQKIYDKDVGFYFNGEEILVFQDLMEAFCHITMSGCKHKTISEDKNIPISLIKKYINFLTENCLISTISYFFSDKTKELSHQKTMIIEDMGIKSYMTQNFGSKLYDMISIKMFIYNEITKQLSHGDVCMTYQKTNNSYIDFIIVHLDKSITPIIVSDTNTQTPPKILKGFHTQYGHLVRRYIKTTSLTAIRSSYHDKEFLCVPHFMIKTIL